MLVRINYICLLVHHRVETDVAALREISRCLLYIKVTMLRDDLAFEHTIVNGSKYNTAWFI